MSTSVGKASGAMATEVWFDSHMMHVRLLDGREISVPVEWFPKSKECQRSAKKEVATDR